MEIKVSVIVHVYNVEKYLEKCLNSIANQTLKEIEILIINDGTKDNSQEIIDKYTKKYKNIKSFIKENTGLSDTRNYGISKAKGKYIAFVDSDDYIDTTMYEKLYKKAISNNYDIVVCDLYYDYGNKLIQSSSNVKNDTTNIKEVMINIYPTAWNKIYKKELLENIKFKKGVWFEDVEFIYRLLPSVKNIGVVSEPLYYYVQRQGQITSKVDKRVYNCIDNLNGIVKYYKDNQYYEEYYYELEYIYVRYIYATFLKTATKYEYKEYLRAIDEAIKNVKKNFPKYKKNPYLRRSIKGIYLLTFNKFYAKMLYIIKHKSR